MTKSTNLIISKERPRLRIFHPRPKPEPGVALVLFREGQKLVTLWPGDRLTSGEVTWGNYQTIYRVDVTEHSFSFSCNLPCKGEAFDFKAQIDVTYCVDDPRLIVKRNTTDVRAVLEPLLVNTMREISRDYEVEQSAEAESSLQRETMERSTQYNIGIRIDRFIVKLSLEDDARDHIRQLKQMERNLIQERKQDQLERQRLELEMERMRMKMDFYGPLIKEGQWQLLALQLSNHPEDVASVAQMIRQQRQAELDNQLRTLKIMLEEDVIEGFQMEEASRRVLQRFVENFAPELDNKALEGTEKLNALETDNKEENS
jgi:hypothetical protein